MASEAVMVAPEQCATAPKTLASKQQAAPAAAKTSTTRVVLLAVLALAAATGAMFGVVVFGNEFTKDMHPKGATLVDSEDRAVATAAVESYVSLLDLPLLGTAELNKVDGITFSTHKGIEHRKVTGYTVTKETAAVGDSEVHTPRLSLATSAPGETIEVSVRDNKAWLREVAGGKTVVTAVDSASQRRLADGGSCLENGACLYSRDELLHLDAASRRLEEGSFFARADVAAYQVELDGDVMSYLSGSDAAYLVGTYSAGGHRFELRAEEASAGTTVLFTNFTSGKAKLLTREGAFVFAYGRLYSCDAVSDFKLFADLSVQAIADDVDFETVEMHRGQAPADFIPVAATKAECLALTRAQANMSTPEAMQRFPKLAWEFQKQDARAAKHNMFKAENRRKLAADAERLEESQEARAFAKELADLMMHPNSGHPLSKEEIFHPSGERRLQAARESRKLMGPGSDTMKAMVGYTEMSHFELWMATRLADPTFKNVWGSFASNDADWAAVAKYGATTMLDLTGQYGVSSSFETWSGFSYLQLVGQPYATGESASVMYTSTSGAVADKDFEDLQMHSMELYAHAFPGSCSGGFSKSSKEFEKDDLYYKAVCTAMEGKPEQGLFCGEAQSMGLLKPTAWASFLSKGPDYVLAFTGTQMHKKEMFVYTTKSSPILFEYKNYVKGYKTGAVVTEGLALYVYQILYCLDFVTNMMGGKLGYITGHSLGGAAATLYSQLLLPGGDIGTSTFLVTFGAPATMNRDCLYGDCPDMKYKWGEDNSYNGEAKVGDISFDAAGGCGPLALQVAEGIVPFIPGSLRIFHKFDPVPSLGYGFGKWAHATQYGMMLFDEPGCKGATKCAPSGTIPSALPGGKKIPGYLCSEGIVGSGKMFMCAPEYYSYTNLVNPFPCVEVIFAQAFMYATTQYTYSGQTPFLPWEDLDECTTSYAATVDAYYETYLASDMELFRSPHDIDYEDAEAVAYLAAFYLMWGFFYVHVTYPNYAMCLADFGETGYLKPQSASGNPVSDALATLKENLPDYDEVVSWFDEEAPPKAPPAPKAVVKAAPKPVYNPPAVVSFAAVKNDYAVLEAPIKAPPKKEEVGRIDPRMIHMEKMKERDSRKELDPKMMGMRPRW